jgi:hypothetical protein
MISEPRVRLAQTMHLSFPNTNTISKRKEEIFHMAHITYEFNHMRPKRFLSLWHVRRKSCIYLASRLALSPNRMKWAFTWASSPRSTIGCIQNDFWAVGMLGANCVAILHRHKQGHQTKTSEIPQDLCHLGVPSGASKTMFEPMYHSTQTVHLSCVKISTMSERCVQNDFWAVGTLGANYAPILHQH